MKGLLRSLHNHRFKSQTIAILTSDHHGSNFNYKSQVLRRKHPVLRIKLNALSLLFQLARYHRNNTDKRLQNNDFRTSPYSSKKPHVFSSFVHYAHAGVMARACILLIRPRTTRVFRIFVTSTQLINREFLAFPSVNYFKNRLIS